MSDLKANPRSERVDLRMSARAKRTLQQAAAITDKTLSEFLLDSGLRAAHDALADRTLFVLDDKAWKAFLKRLDQPANPNPRLRKLLARKPAWKR